VGMKKTKEKVGNKIPQVYKTYFYGSLKILSPSSYFFSEQILGTLEEILMFTKDKNILLVLLNLILLIKIN